MFMIYLETKESPMFIQHLISKKKWTDWYAQRRTKSYPPSKTTSKINSGTSVKLCGPTANKAQKTKLWTNNFCESINKVFRQVTDWKKLKLHELVIELEKFVSTRLIDLQRSLYKTGNYELVPCFKKLSMANFALENLSPQQRSEAFKKLLNSKNPESKKKKKNQQSTSMPSFSIRHHSNAGKKPQQSASGRGVKTSSKRKMSRAPEKENTKKNVFQINDSFVNYEARFV